VAPRNFLSVSFELRPPTGRFIACPVETTMKYDLEESLGQPLPEAYETLLEDILDSDQSLFIRADEIETMWEKVEPRGMEEVGSFDGEKAFKAISQTDKNLFEE
jgi:glucose-6-phosphate 1-dehydrogenase